LKETGLKKMCDSNVKRRRRGRFEKGDFFIPRVSEKKSGV
jgi:hypothetical protein